MPRVSKAQLKGDQFRSRAAEILKDPDWLDEGVRHWLEKLLRLEREYTFTENEHAALARIIAAGILFDSWDGHTVPELRAAACRYKADGNDDDQRVLNEFEARNALQLRLGEMGHLIGFCRNVAALPLAPFKPEIPGYEDIP